MNVLLVDDDFFVIKALESKINWTSLSVECVFSSYNVVQAREILLQHPIHILICDIEMPQGSGLDLLAWLRSEHYNLQAIILTNYADFNYAQKAIELQSFDYFLKPIEFDKLTLIIQKAIAKAREQQQNEQAIREGSLWNKNRKTILEDFWNKLILGKAFPSSPSSNAAFVVEPNLPYQADDLFLPVLVNLFPYAQSLGKNDKSLYDYSFLNVMYESFQSHLFSIEIITEIKEYNWMLILKWNGPPESEEVELLCSSFIRKANQFLKSDACCFLSVSRKLDQIRKAIQDLQQKNDTLIKHRNQTLLLEHVQSDETVYSPPDMVLLELLLNQGNYAAFLDETGTYLKTVMQGQVLDKSVLSLFRLDMIQLVYSHLKSREIQAHKLYTGKVNDQLFMQSLNSIEDLHHFLIYLVDTAANSLKFAEQSQSVIDEVKQYIHSHYGKDLSRTSLAEIVYLNPDYLARIFKKEMGIPLGTYIIQTRIAAAKRLLETTNQSVYAISTKVGYSNYSHFSKLFRQEAGCSPNEYRKKQHQRQG
ncbi:response regulator transcription factor [Gorillibacterium massiliense]|uniref:response regulator transcription factor n=1 Tax=Gorillibacterium massiliense TaxID=1280390 RepID=UPI0004B9290A|nr:helix-turn-helix domain-containing protein [Gorillibacterium massiliense]